MTCISKAVYAAVACCCLTGTISAQNIALKMNNVTVKQAMEELEKKSGYSFVFSSQDVDTRKRISVSAENEDVRTVVQQILNGQNVTCEIQGKNIVVRKITQQKAPTGKLKTVTGTILDPQGVPVIGANIIVKGTTNGTISDLDGKFTLEVPEDGILQVSYIGFNTQDIAVAGKNDLAIKLREDSEALDEVVVIGYGQTSAKKLVSSVTSVKGETLQDLPFATVTSTLQGRASGVIVQNQGGEPGKEPKISIRGGGDPVYVIDGVISDAWDFQTLNPNDIESLSVLKDAASLAVYGSRAADGIILVKTKEGKKGKRAITYTFNAQYSQPTILPDKIDSYTYADIQNQAAMNDGYGEFYQFSQEEMEIIRNQSDPYTYPNTDWYDLGLKNFAPEYRHSLSLTGNQKDVNYYLSLGMFDQGSLYTSDALSYQRYNLRSNVNTTFEEIGLKVGVNVNAAYEKRKRPLLSTKNGQG